MQNRKPKLLDQMRTTMRRYIYFHKKRHPSEMDAAEVSPCGPFVIPRMASAVATWTGRAPDCSARAAARSRYSIALFGSLASTAWGTFTRDQDDRTGCRLRA